MGLESKSHITFVEMILHSKNQKQI